MTIKDTLIILAIAGVIVAVGLFVMQLAGRLP